MSTKKDFALNVYTHDMEILNSDFHFVEGLEYIRQKLKILLLFIYGEWYLDTEKGVKFQDILWVKNPDMIQVDSVLKAALMDSEYVLEILSFTSNLNNASRILTITFTVNTIEGILSTVEEL